MSRFGRFALGNSLRYTMPPRDVVLASNIADMDSTDRRFTVADNATLKPSSFTMNIWCKRAADATVSEGMFDKFTSGTGYMIFMKAGTGTPRAACGDGTNTSATATTNIADGDPHMVTATFNAGTGDLKIYIDGSLEATTGSSVLSNTTDSLSISGDGANTQEFEGALGFAGLWSSDIGQANITTLYNAGDALAYSKIQEFGLTGNLISYWHLANWTGSPGTEIEDQHGSNDLTANNSPTYDVTGLNVRTA